jgi:hypothetical protein
MYLINCAFFGERNFNIIKTHDTTLKIIVFSVMSDVLVQRSVEEISHHKFKTTN